MLFTASLLVDLGEAVLLLVEFAVIIVDVSVVVVVVQGQLETSHSVSMALTIKSTFDFV